MRATITFTVFALTASFTLGAQIAEARKQNERARRATHGTRPTLLHTRWAPPLPVHLTVKNIATPGESELDRWLQKELNRLLATAPMRRAVNGIHIVDTKSGKALFSYGADRQLNPASNVKLISTATALDALGPEFRFKTRLFGVTPDESGVVHGDLYVVGSADPTLRHAHLSELAMQLRARGISRIEGDVVVGIDDLRDAVASPGFRIRAVSTGSGTPAAITVSPQLDLLQIQGKVTSTRRRRRVRIRGLFSSDRKSGKWTITVSGTVRSRRRGHAFVRVSEPALFTAHTLRAALATYGIALTGGVRRSPVRPSDLAELAMHESMPLGNLVTKINKPSSNFLADRTIMSVGGAIFGGDPHMRKGIQAMARYLERLGINPGKYRIDNGSGLSYTNHLSARQIAEVLHAASSNPHFAPEFVASLSVAGKDGTLSGRFRRGPESGWIRGKTGTLYSVAALSGFLSATPGGRRLSFVILSNGFRRRQHRQIRSRQMAIVKTLHRYLAASDHRNELSKSATNLDEVPLLRSF